MNLIGIDRVSEKTTLSRSTIYAYAAVGKFPRAVRVGVRQVGWVESEVDAWLQDRIENHRATQLEGVAA